MFSFRVAFLAILGVLLVVVPVSAAVRLPSILSDHAVLTRTGRVPIWGWAEAGEAITVMIGEHSGKAIANASGKWRVDLDLSQSGPGPFDLTIEGTNRIVVRDVVVGDVWVASGQSNMDWRVGESLEAGEEAARAPDPLVRQFSVAQATAMEPMEDCQGRWIVAAPATVGEFTAAGYFFAKELFAKRGIPVGLLHASWGGMNIERWIGARGFAHDPALNARAEELIAKTRQSLAEVASYQEALRTWETRYERADLHEGKAADYAAPGLPTDDWQRVTLPGPLSAAGLPDAGAVWLRRTVNYPKVLGSTQFNIGHPEGFVEAYWNGARVGDTSPKNLPGSATVSFFVPEKQIKPGDNTLAIRLFQAVSGAAISKAIPNSFNLDFGSKSLDGEWFAKVERALPPLTPEALAARVATPIPVRQLAVPSGMFNAMIHPLIPHAIRGVLWYQGESNTDRAVQYETALKLLITGWRETWGQPEVPFLICQLPNNGKKTTDPTAESKWAELREAQSRALALPNVGLAVLIDLGEAADLHPRSKKEAGRRLALLARELAHGEKIESGGPVYESMTVEGDALRLRFRHTGGGLIALPLPESYRPRSNQPETVPLVLPVPGSQLQGFAICGADRQWVWATAEIDGDTVLVKAPGLAAPIAARYAWADNPTCNLSNGAKLPAMPFRTDDFPLSTRDQNY